MNAVYLYTLQGTNISHLGKSKNIFKSALVGDMLIPWRVRSFFFSIPRQIIASTAEVTHKVV